MAVISPINFLAHDPIYVAEKPYSLKYQPPDGFPSDNIISEVNDQSIEDVRGREHEFSVPQNGFAVLFLPNKMTYDDYDDQDKVREVYCPQVAESVKALLGASRVQIFEHVVRKREASFPIATGRPYKYNQPTTAAHVDMTPDWAMAMAEHMNSSIGKSLPSENFQFVNIWKPLRGPVQDWPLALCDPTTVDAGDIRKSDVVFNDLAIENYLVHFNPNQKWYYLSNQTSAEAWVFLQADSLPNGLRGAPHSSFLHPNHLNTDHPRESIEVRAIVYYENGR